MKLLFLIFLFAVNCNLFAQKSNFVRVYNLTGINTYKGNILMVTDTSLQLYRRSDTVTIPVRSIGSIKTKRSVGNNVLIGSIIGASAGVAYGVATADPDQFLGYTAGEGAAVGVILGAPVGAAVGGLSGFFKKINTYKVNGDIMKWKDFQTAITK